MPAQAPKNGLPGWFFPVLSLVVYCVLCAFFLTRIRHGNGGTFVYTLDDTYIHLALSDSIAHGTYGINAGESTSPSSSMLWPLLLAPFARLSWFTYLPLLLNFVFGAAAAWLFGSFVAGLRSKDASPGDTLRRLLTVVALLFIGNLTALTFIGMEHALQVLLAGACAWGVIACLRGERIPWWCLAAGLLGPSVRYENVGLTLALALALWAQRRHRSAVLVCGLSVLPLIGFALFLHHLGLPALPLSVLVKGHAVGAHHNIHAAIGQHIAEIADNFASMPIVWIVSLLFVILVSAWLLEPKADRRLALFGAAAAVGLHILIGRFGWHNRYEVYIVVFGALVVLELDWEVRLMARLSQAGTLRRLGLAGAVAAIGVHLLMDHFGRNSRYEMCILGVVALGFLLLDWQRRHIALGWYVLGLLACSAVYLRGTFDIPADSHAIYVQQFQTSRLAHALPTTNVAVNDLGLVAYHHPQSQYVLDLAGLASVEAASVPHTTEWMDSITRRHNVGLVAIYPNWFPDAPASWTKIGELCRGGYDSCVFYYATGPENLQRVRDSFMVLTRSLPPDVTVNLP